MRGRNDHKEKAMRSPCNVAIRPLHGMRRFQTKAGMEKKNKSGKKSLVDDLIPLVRDLERIKQQARALGMFTDDRELLECPRCGLLEDVTAVGLLIAYPKAKQRDEGLWSAFQSGG